MTNKQTKTQTLRIKTLTDLFYWIGRHQLLSERDPKQAMWIQESC